MFRRLILCLITGCFSCSLIITPQASAGEYVLNLPVPGAMVSLSPSYEPALIKGLTVHKENPFLFDFIVDAGNDPLLQKQEADRLIKYFFACLTIPEKDLWVNLSPYEKERMIPQGLGQTALGRDLLAQDYILKQLTASLIYPEKDLGREFWARIYAKAQKLYGTTQIPVNTFNKVWILADKASVYENGQTAFVLDGHLKVMLEDDYLAATKHRHGRNILGTDTNSWPKMGLKAELVSVPNTIRNDVASIGANIVRELILPEIENEVNTGKNFVFLRQILNSLILANWYKNNLKEALLNQVYTNKNTVKGVNLNDPSIKERIYQQYLKAYKKGVFNYIKEEANSGVVAGHATPLLIPRKYFSGGFAESNEVAHPRVFTNRTIDSAQLARLDAQKDLTVFTVALLLNSPLVNALPDAAMAVEDSIDGRNISQEVRIITANKKVQVDAQIYPAELVARALLAIDDNGRMFKIESLNKRSAYLPLLKVLPQNLKLGKALISKLTGFLKRSLHENAYPENLLGLGFMLDRNAVDSAAKKDIDRWTFNLLQGIYGTKEGAIFNLDTAMMGNEDRIMINGVEIARTKLEQIIGQLRKLSGEGNIARRNALIKLAKGQASSNGVIIGEGIVSGIGLFDGSQNRRIERPDPGIAKIVLALVNENGVVTKLWDPRKGAALSSNETMFVPVAGEVSIQSDDAPEVIELDVMLGDGMKLETSYKIGDESEVINPPLNNDQTISLSKQNGEKVLELTNIGQGLKVTNVSPQPFILKAYGEDVGAAEDRLVTDFAMTGDNHRITDSALNVKEYGGIDLTNANSGITVTRGAKGEVKVDLDPALIARIGQEGVRSAQPIIISVTTMRQAQMRPLLGRGLPSVK